MRIKLHIAYLVCLFVSSAMAEEIVLVKDVNTNPRHLDISTVCRAGTKEFLFANDGVRGSELWIGNGLAGTKLVKDIRSGVLGGVQGLNCIALNDQTIVFAANDGTNGTELWSSDGTAAGTAMIKDIFAGESSSSPSSFVLLGSTILFSAQDGNGIELWKTDGTANGTVMVKDIYAGTENSTPQSLTKLNDTTVLFSATTMAAGRELWRSDGTDSGTSLVQDIRNGANGSNPALFVLLNGVMYFAASTPATGVELFRSDGTDGGTSIVKDIYNGNQAGVSNFSRLNVLGNKLIFTGITAATGSELFESDGTDGGTNLLVEFIGGATSGSPSSYVAINGQLFFTASTAAAGREAWVTDGTAGGTIQLADIGTGMNNGASDPIAYANEAQSLLTFAASPQGEGEVELWATDGTVGATTKLINLFPGSNEFMRTDAGPTSAGLAFGLPAPVDSVPQGGAFLTNGTVAGTSLHPGALSGFTESSVPTALGVLNSKLIFAADNGTNGYELWSTDGTEAGTERITDINSGVAWSVVPRAGFAILGSKLIFVAATADVGTELWVTDGTSGGTALLKDIEPGPFSAFNSNGPISKFHVLGNEVLFAANTSAEGRELWKTDGTPGGTVIVEDIRPGTGSSINEGFEAMVADSPAVLFFAANDGVNGSELWVSDGTPGNTLLLANINPAAASSNPQHFAKNPSPGSGVAFQACTANEGCEPWFSTGLATAMIEDIVTGNANSFPENFQFVTTGKLFFTANTPDNGDELWFSLGSAMTTNITRDIVVGNGGSIPRDLTPLSATHIIFRACQEASQANCEVWTSDGSEAGTLLVKDIVAGTESSNPSGFTVLNGIAYFVGTTGVIGQGTRFFRSDGTEAGTTALTSQGEAEISIEDQPTLFVPALGTLFVAAYHTGYGYELFKIGEDACPSDPAKSFAGICGCGVVDADDDGDGIINCQESCPADQNKSAPGTCGCGVADTDSNNNGVANCIEDAITTTAPPKPTIKITKNKKSGKRKVTITMTASEGVQYQLFTRLQKKKPKKGKTPKFKSKIYTSNEVIIKSPRRGAKLFVKYQYVVTGTSVTSPESEEATKKF